MKSPVFQQNQKELGGECFDGGPTSTKISTPAAGDATKFATAATRNATIRAFSG